MFLMTITYHPMGEERANRGGMLSSQQHCCEGNLKISNNIKNSILIRLASVVSTPNPFSKEMPRLAMDW